MTTNAQTVADDVVALLRARNPLLWCGSREEARVERYLAEAASKAGYIPLFWDAASGITDLAGRAQSLTDNDKDPGLALEAIRNRALAGTAQRTLWIMRDLPPWLDGPIGYTTLRQLRNLARLLPGTARDRAQAVVVLSPSSTVPPELSVHATVVDWPLPDRSEIAAALDAAIEALPDSIRATAAPNGTREQAIDAAIGLSGEEASATFARSLVKLRRVDPALIAAEKKRVIARQGLLQWFDPLPGGLDAVGGLDVLKSWLVARASAYTPEARAYGLPAPRGVLLVGVPGGGKSLSAKAIATSWNAPLLRFDLGAQKSKFVGESERQIRQSLGMVDAIGRCVLWIDEIDLALGGATQGAADGGVSSDALGTLLSWMQDRTSEAFVIATANNVEQLPPELLRKGRFDELFFVDLPNALERDAIIRAALRSHGRTIEDLAGLANATEGFSGAEIAALVPEALFAAFNDDGRQPTAADLFLAARSVVPLSKTAPEKISRLRDWAKGRARLATSATATPEEARRGRALDL
jgi:hypothetical protein